jgi:hypothetical protein
MRLEMTADWATLESQLISLAEGYRRLAELIEDQRSAIGRADPSGLAEVGLRIETQWQQVVGLETVRRQTCQRLAERFGLNLSSPGAMRMETLIRLAGGQWAIRLRQAVDRLKGEADRVSQGGQVNLNVARKLTGFCGDLLGQVSRVGRETGCYNARGQRALAREPIGMFQLSMVG